MIDTSQFETRVWVDKWDDNRPLHVSFKNFQGEQVSEYKYRAKRKKTSNITDLSKVESVDY